MFTKKGLLDFVFFDIETTPSQKNFDLLPENLKKIWLEKYHLKAFDKEIENRKKKETLSKIKNGDSYPPYESSIVDGSPSVNEIFIKEAALYPEFANVYCISFGLFNKHYDPILSTCCEATEKETIESFLTVLNHYPTLNLMGYNSNDFDVPFLLKRMWINSLCNNYPPQLQLKDAKPWTVKNQDLMVNYKAGSWTSIGLNLLSESLGVKSPKGKFNNDEFTTLLLNGKITKEDAIEYCEGDVRALMECCLKMASDTSNFEKEAAPKVWAKSKSKETTV